MSRANGTAGIVTGASSGIGAAIARRMAAEGADLVLVAAPGEEGELERVAGELAGGVRVETLAADVGLPATAEAAVARASAAFGRLDWLASNAGIAYYEEDVLAGDVERFDHTFHVNVRGMYLMALASARAMAPGGRGAIVCTTSTMALIAVEGYTAYTASKGAVAQLVRGLSVDLAPYGIRVNALAPGLVRTPRTAELIDDPPGWAKGRVRIPLDRVADAAEMASVVAFLLSDDASYMTGSIVVADGGMTAGFRDSDWAAVPGDAAPRTRTPPLKGGR